MVIIDLPAPQIYVSALKPYGGTLQGENPFENVDITDPKVDITVIVVGMVFQQFNSFHIRP